MNVHTTPWMRAPKSAEVPMVAIGDVHGRYDLLARMHDHLRDQVIPPYLDQGFAPLVAHMGDYIDRGPHSVKALRAALTYDLPGCDMLVLPGNHEQMMVGAMPEEGIDSGYEWLWLRNGGKKVLLELGLPPDHHGVMGARDVLAPELAQLRKLPTAHIVGPWLLVHAGVPVHVDPIDVPLMDWRADVEQEDRHPLWVREPFLHRNAPFPGYAVVHGHTIARAPEVYPWRVGIDTGAYSNGILTAVEIQGQFLRFHQAVDPT